MSYRDGEETETPAESEAPAEEAKEEVAAE